MLANGQFFSSFVATMGAIGVLVVLAGIVFVIFRARQIGNALRQVSWGIGVGVLVVCSLPLLVFAVVGMPLRSIIGVAAAGALIGMGCAPFIARHYGRLGVIRALGISLLTIVGGAWGSSMLVAIVIAMASD